MPTCSPLELLNDARANLTANMAVNLLEVATSSNSIVAKVLERHIEKLTQPPSNNRYFREITSYSEEVHELCEEYGDQQLQNKVKSFRLAFSYQKRRVEWGEILPPYLIDNRVINKYTACVDHVKADYDVMYKINLRLGVEVLLSRIYSFLGTAPHDLDLILGKLETIKSIINNFQVVCIYGQAASELKELYHLSLTQSVLAQDLLSLMAAEKRQRLVLEVTEWEKNLERDFSTEEMDVIYNTALTRRPFKDFPISDLLQEACQITFRNNIDILQFIVEGMVKAQSDTEEKLHGAYYNGILFDLAAFIRSLLLNPTLIKQIESHLSQIERMFHCTEEALEELKSPSSSNPKNIDIFLLNCWLVLEILSYVDIVFLEDLEDLIDFHSLGSELLEEQIRPRLDLLKATQGEEARSSTSSESLGDYGWFDVEDDYFGSGYSYKQRMEFICEQVGSLLEDKQNLNITKLGQVCKVVKEVRGKFTDLADLFSKLQQRLEQQTASMPLLARSVKYYEQSYINTLLRLSEMMDGSFNSGGELNTMVFKVLTLLNLASSDLPPSCLSGRRHFPLGLEAPASSPKGKKVHFPENEQLTSEREFFKDASPDGDYTIFDPLFEGEYVPLDENEKAPEVTWVERLSSKDIEETIASI